MPSESVCDQTPLSPQPTCQGVVATSRCLPDKACCHCSYLSVSSLKLNRITTWPAMSQHESSLKRNGIMGSERKHGIRCLALLASARLSVPVNRHRLGSRGHWVAGQRWAIAGQVIKHGHSRQLKHSVWSQHNTRDNSLGVQLVFMVPVGQKVLLKKG